MKTQCPHCKVIFNVSEDHLGKKAKCSKCQQSFIVTPQVIESKKMAVQKIPVSVTEDTGNFSSIEPTSEVVEHGFRQQEREDKRRQTEIGMEKCANCNREIGNLEQRHVYNNSVVCSTCYAKLTGSPMSVEVNSGDITIQKTSKKWKARWLIGILLFISGIIWIGCAFSLESEKGGVIGSVMCIVGLIMCIHARFCSWWYHG